MSNYSDFEIQVPMGKNSGEYQTTCPKCSHTRKKKTQKCLSVNLDKKVWRCNHCEWSGALKTQYSKPEYKRPTFTNNTEISDKLVQWFAGRGISQATLNAAKITESKEFMPQLNKEVNCINFNYFRGGELINVKYRDGAKNFKLFKDAEKILYNLDNATNQETIYIVEGEMDVLAFMEAGINNVVSVPNGAVIGTNKLDYIDNSFDAIEGFKTLIIAVDNDAAGRKLAEDLLARFGVENCKYIDWGKCKDANDYLIEYGAVKLKEHILAPKDYPIEGVFSVSDYSNEIFDLYNNGLDMGWDSGFIDFDRTFRIVKGYMTCITGIPGHGKSEFLDQIILGLVLNSGCKIAYFSPENKPTKLHFSKLARKIVGKSWSGYNRMSVGEVNQVIEALDNKVFFIQPEQNYTIETILTRVKQLKQKHGIDLFVIDAWNTLEHKYTESETKYIGEALSRFEKFCVQNQVHFFLVAHPTKMPYDPKNKKFIVPTPYHISGSANFYNKFDNHITVYRDFDQENVEVHITKVKFAHWGDKGVLYFWYDKESGRYYGSGGVDKNNWLISGIEKAQPKEYTRLESTKEGVENMKAAKQEEEQLPFEFDESENPFGDE